MGIEKARILLISASRGSRSIIKTILLNMGFNNIYVGESFEELEQRMKAYPPDLLIFDSDFSANQVYDLVKKVRHNNYGVNPFLTVIAISNSPTQDVVSGVLKSGVDDLLIHPYSTGQFIERIHTLINARKPFVVTSDYIGPDRRNHARYGESEDIPLLTVPNALYACYKNKMDRKRFDEGVRAVAEEVNIMRLDRNGVQFNWLVKRILAGFSWSDGHALEPDVVELLQTLYSVSSETILRLEGTPYSHVSSICEALKQLSKKMFKKRFDISAKDQELLSELSDAFRIAFKEVDSDEIASSILAETKKATA